MTTNENVLKQDVKTAPVVLDIDIKLIHQVYSITTVSYKLPKQYSRKIQSIAKKQSIDHDFKLFQNKS